MGSGLCPDSACAIFAGVRSDALGFAAVVDARRCARRRRSRCGHLVTPNAHHVALLQEDALLSEIYWCAFRVVPDEIPLLWAATLLGAPLRRSVNGTDLFETAARRRCFR